MAEDAVLVVDAAAGGDVRGECLRIALLEGAQGILAAQRSIFSPCTVISDGGAGWTVRAKNGGWIGCCMPGRRSTPTRAGISSATTASGSVKRRSVTKASDRVDDLAACGRARGGIGRQGQRDDRHVHLHGGGGNRGDEAVTQDDVDADHPRPAATPAARPARDAAPPRRRGSPGGRPASRCASAHDAAAVPQ